MGKALKFGDRYALQYPIRAFDENETGLHTQAIIGRGRLFAGNLGGSCVPMILFSTWPIHHQGFYGDDFDDLRLQ